MEFWGVQAAGARGRDSSPRTPELAPLPQAFFLQTVLALKVSDGVAKEGAVLGLRTRPWMPSFIFVAIYSAWSHLPSTKTL